MNICKFCEKEFNAIKNGDYCNASCYRKWWQNNLKITNPTKYRDRLNQQNKRRRDCVRKRLELPLDHPQINESGKGYKMKEGYKYILLKNHPNAAKSGYVADHIVVMCKHIGRPLNDKETVHHRNGIRDDNRLKNLELWSNSHPYGQRVEDKVEWCKEFLSQYGYKVIKE